ncbi:MAG: hypothetical protein CFE31_15690 [Rhizobiales bacterium PAR1]|nr:MAG: hypothetical protein CFE31_15690 [Rhizobiales bacterium PAR1]
MPVKAPEKLQDGMVDSRDALPGLRRAKRRSEGATKLRQTVLEVLSGSSVPLSAYDVLRRLQGETSIAPMQVYRVLDTLLDSGLIHKLASRPAFVRRAHLPGAERSVVFMVCRECSRVKEGEISNIAQQLVETAAEAGFRAYNPIVEIEGQCADCANKGHAA